MRNVAKLAWIIPGQGLGRLARLTWLGRAADDSPEWTDWATALMRNICRSNSPNPEEDLSGLYAVDDTDGVRLCALN